MKTDKLKKLIIDIFVKYGLSKDHALISANALINAELVGAYGHGLSRLKMYCDRINKKVIKAKPKIKVKKISSSISHIDADDSIGLSVFSPPFPGMYVYTNSPRDMGNVRNDAEFFAHFGYLIDELARVMMRGRVVAMHCIAPLKVI